MVHYDLPKDTESFLHRSGRTGRAGKTGTTIAVLLPRTARAFRRICQETKISDLEWITTACAQRLSWQLPQSRCAEVTCPASCDF